MSQFRQEASVEEMEEVKKAMRILADALELNNIGTKVGYLAFFNLMMCSQIRTGQSFENFKRVMMQVLSEAKSKWKDAEISIRNEKLEDS